MPVSIPKLPFAGPESQPSLENPNKSLAIMVVKNTLEMCAEHNQCSSVSPNINNSSERCGLPHSCQQDINDDTSFNGNIVNYFITCVKAGRFTDLPDLLSVIP